MATFEPEGIQRLRERLIAQERKNTPFEFWTHLNEIKAIIREYYHTNDFHKLTEPERWAHPDFVALAESDLRGPGKPNERGFKHKHRVLIRTTGQSLKEQLLWADIRDILIRLEGQTVRIGEIAISGWYAYVLQQWVGFGKLNEDWPEPTDAHQASAIKVFARGIEKLI